jgi:hypothetical protein
VLAFLSRVLLQTCQTLERLLLTKQLIIQACTYSLITEYSSIISSVVDIHQLFYKIMNLYAGPTKL